MGEIANEIALRAHIRNLLLDYSHTHITTNYVTFTQDAVAEILSSGLFLVPENDPMSVALHIDPLDNLSSILGLRNLPTFQEVWRPDAEAIHKLKQSLTVKGQLRSEKCWFDDPDTEYKWSMCRLMSPVLTTRAVRETPRIGSNKIIDIVPASQTAVLNIYDIKPVDEEDTPASAPIDIEEALNVKQSVDPKIRREILALLQSIPRSSRDANESTHSLEFLRVDSPPLIFPRPISPILFAKDEQPGYSTKTTVPSGITSTHAFGLDSLMDLGSWTNAVGKPEREEDDVEMHMQHMVVVDGWQTLHIASSPTPSLGNSSSQVDELFLPSPPDTSSNFTQLLLSAKMDDYEIPRSEKIGGSRTKTEGVGYNQSLGEFLSSNILQRNPPNTNDSIRIVTTPKSLQSSPNTTITASMLEQATLFTSELDDHDEIAPDDYENIESDNNDLKSMVRRLYTQLGGIPDEDPRDLILGERMDEEDALLMDVPNLKPPTVHPPSGLCIPSCYAEMLILSKNITGVSGINTETLIKPLQGIDVNRFIKKVKGIQPLNIELSWRPFIYGLVIPTHEEVAEVASDIRLTFLENMNIANDHTGLQLDHLLNELSPADHITPSIQSWHREDGSITLGTNMFAETSMLILTREERYRSLGIPYEAIKTQQDFVKEVAEADYPQSQMPYENSSKRRKVDAYQTNCSSPTAMKEATTHLNDLDDAEQYLLDDSGVFVNNPALPGAKGLFVNLCDEAEGFEGLDVDGELFPDMHHLHLVNSASASPQYHAPYSLTTSVAMDPPYECSSNMLPVLGSSPYGGFDDAVEFLPLSFDGSQSNPNNTVVIPLCSVGITTNSMTPDKAGLSGTSVLPAAAVESSAIPQPAKSTDVISVRPMLAQYLALHGKMEMSDSVKTVTNTDALEEMAVPQQPLVPAPATLPSIPDEVVNEHTFCITAELPWPNSRHRYMASAEMLQKRVLVQSLSSGQCGVELIERDDLGDVHLILDVDTAVVYTSLLSLPSQCEHLNITLNKISWRFLYVLVIFESYPTSWSAKNDRVEHLSFDAFSPPVIKAVQKLRRNIAIANGCGTACADTTFLFAFANTVTEAALLTRMFADNAENHDCTNGVLWGDRRWLEADEQEGEYDLADINGMNAFAASIILAEASLEDFLNQDPEERHHNYAGFIGARRISEINEVIARQTKTMQSPLASQYLRYPVPQSDL